MKRAFVTGASGFIGKHLVLGLLESQWQITCLVRCATSLPESVRKKVTVIEADVGAADRYAAAVADSEYVFHLAGITRAANRKDVFRVNVDGTRNVMQAASQCDDPPVVVLMSSLAAAGPSPSGSPRNEATPVSPVSNYGQSKLAAEQTAFEFSDRIPISIIRPGIVFGPDDDGTHMLISPIDRFGIHLVPGWNTRRASMIHVSDLVRAVVLCATNGERVGAWTGSNASSQNEAGTGIYFVGDEYQPTYIELGRMIAAALGRRRVFNLRIANWAMRIIGVVAELINRVQKASAVLGLDKSRDLVAPNWTSDTTKIRDGLGFTPDKPLSLRWVQTVTWYRRHGCLVHRASHQSCGAGRSTVS